MFHMDIWVTLIIAGIVGGTVWAVYALIMQNIENRRGKK